MSGWVVATPLHVLTFLCRETAAATFMLPGYPHGHVLLAAITDGTLQLSKPTRLQWLQHTLPGTAP